MNFSLRLRTTLALVMSAVVAVVALVNVKADAFGINSPSGIDVASWQHPGGAPIDWNAVAADGQKYAFIKATEGVGYLNPHFLEDTKGAAAAGMLVGSYHMARPTQSASLQAAEYAAALATMPQPSLPPVLDIEYADGVGPVAMQNWVREFLSELTRLTGRTPMIYTYRYFWENEVGNTTEFNNYPLWMAAYQSQPPTVLPGGWDYMTFWQRTNDLQVSGMPTVTDANLFNGTKSDLDGFAAGMNVNLGQLLTPGIDLGRTAAQLEALGNKNPELVGAILALGAGIVAVSTVMTVAQNNGIDVGMAKQIAEQAETLAKAGQLPTGDLQTMLAVGDYTIGDLLILLKNALKVAREAGLI